jgi:putative peptide zinc metalloprotease protein
MLCRACHVHTRRDFPYCLHCGTARKGAKLTAFAAPTLRRQDRDEPAVALAKPVTTIGRGPDNDVVVDDPSVSRQHARVLREPGGFVLEDLDSFNGTAIGERTLHGERATLPDQALLHIGDVPVRFEQPRSVAVGSKTIVRGTEHTLLTVDGGEPQAPTATEPLSVRPRRRAGWALKRVPDERGQQRWVLRNTRSGAYLQLDARDVFVWEHIDGENTVRDLLFLYAQEYAELALPRIERALRAFDGLGLLRGMPSSAAARSQPALRRAGRTVLRVLLRMELSIRGIDTAVGWLYRRIGWRFFTRTGVLALWLLIAAGLYGFWQARAHARLFDVGGAGMWGLVAVAVGYLLALVAHEAAHALAVKSYGRRVTRGGFMMMMGMPFAFVDTSDMWFGSRWSRIVVTLSGPLSTAGIAGGLALTSAYAPSPVVRGLCFQLAFGLYLNTLYNLNPLMPLDGYQALADALRMPRLRQEAMAYATKGFWRDLLARRRPGLRQVGLVCYGLAAVAGTYLFLVLGIVAWDSRLGGLVHRHLRPPLDTLAIVAGIALVLFPVWWRYARSAVALARRLAARRRAAVQPAAEVAEVAA